MQDGILRFVSVVLTVWHGFCRYKIKNKNMGHYCEQKVKSELYEAHCDKFAYMERIINSCETNAQLINAVSWAKDVLSNIERAERARRHSFNSLNAVSKYIQSRRDIIFEVYRRKDDELRNNMLKKNV